MTQVLKSNIFTAECVNDSFRYHHWIVQRDFNKIRLLLLFKWTRFPIKSRLDYKRASLQLIHYTIKTHIYLYIQEQNKWNMKSSIAVGTYLNWFCDNNSRCWYKSDVPFKLRPHLFEISINIVYRCCLCRNYVFIHREVRIPSCVYNVHVILWRY